ncbi:MAG TPA: SRPBCC domain-containing protein [Jiangellaceae bacterium]|nr:SRPBCC domain-containing protein [Jiangellaceae bacterium]
MTTTTTATTQVCRVYIKATAQAIWDAITTPEWTERYGYGGRVEFDLRPSGAFRSIANEEMQAAGGGWSEVLSDLKSLLETGKPLVG